MPFRRPFSRLSVVLVAVLVLIGSTALYQAASAPQAHVVAAVAASPTPPPPSPSPSPSPGGCQSPPSASTPADPFGASPVQDSIEDIGQQIMDLVDQNGYPGFTGLIPDPDHALLVVCWLHGDPLPAPIASIVANPGQPITLVRQDAAFSSGDLTARADSLLNNTSLDGQIAGSLNAVTVPEEGSGLIAGVQPNDPNTFNVAQAQATLSSAAGVPVTIEIEPADTQTTRLNDNSPWFGGARLTSGATNCSSGFGVVKGNVQLLLTAAHCFAVAAAVTNGGNAVGNVANRFAGPDSESIQIGVPGQAGGSVFTGGVNDATEGSVKVTRVGVNLVNQFVSASGSFSGENRLLRVLRTNRRLRVRNGAAIIIVAPMTIAVATVPKFGVFVAVASGDSGGPVIRRRAGVAGVSGMGTIVAGSGVNFACVVYAARNCFTRVVYNSLRGLLPLYGANLSKL
jgi:hypothetical protein